MVISRYRPYGQRDFNAVRALQRYYRGHRVRRAIRDWSYDNTHPVRPFASIFK